MKCLNKLIVFLLMFFTLFTVNCGGGRSGGKTYDQQMSYVLNLYRRHKFKAASKRMAREASSIMKRNKVDRFLAFLEVGKMALASRYYRLAIKYMTIAERRFLNIEGTISISEETSSIFLDDTSKEYMPEPHEKIMISPYLALAYAARGDYRGASVERNRVMSRVSEYVERTNKRWLENSFARYLSAVMYEHDDKLQDARLEYRKILRYSRYKGDTRDALQRLNSRGKGNLVVFIDIGIAPIKKQAIYNRRVHTSEGPVRVKFAYAVMKRFKYNRIKRVRVLIDGEPAGESDLLYNLEQVVMRQFKKNKPKIKKAILKRVLPRVIAQVAGQAMARRSDSTAGRVIGSLISLGAKIGMAIERADTRTWLTLPRFIHTFRKRDLSEGRHKIQLIYLDASGSRIGNSASRTINIKRQGDVSIVHFAAPY